jgi:hypothetical protein
MTQLHESVHQAKEVAKKPLSKILIVAAVALAAAGCADPKSKESTETAAGGTQAVKVSNNSHNTAPQPTSTPAPEQASGDNGDIVERLAGYSFGGATNTAQEINTPREVVVKEAPPINGITGSQIADELDHATITAWDITESTPSHPPTVSPDQSLPDHYSVEVKFLPGQ